MKQVLFLCTGNYYRSRFAEVLFDWKAEQVDLAWRAKSKGLALDARNIGPISLHALTRLGNLSIPVDRYLREPAPLTRCDLENADLVIAVKAAEHRALLEAQFAQWVEQVEFWRIDDLDCAAPEVALPVLEECVHELVQRLSATTNSSAA